MLESLSTYSVKYKKTPFSRRETPRTGETTAERRRIGKIEHDERGAARLRWLDAPAGFARDPLALEPNGPLSLQQEDSFNPYDRTPAERRDARPRKRDLRKLSEWIKAMRALEEKKSRGGE